MATYKLLITRTQTAEMEVEAESPAEARAIAVQQINSRLTEGDLDAGLTWERDGGIHIENLN